MSICINIRRTALAHLALACFFFSPAHVHARSVFQPHEALNPAKAQALPLTPLEIESAGKVHKFKVEVAATPEQQQIGLMHRAELAADRGMLFAYDRPTAMRFWMRNTFIPLDMLFLKGDGRVAFIIENAQPHDESPLGPSTRMNAQLELPAGTVSKLGIKVGDMVRHPVFGNAPAP